RILKIIIPILPSSANLFIFIMALVITFMLNLTAWVVIPCTINQLLTPTFDYGMVLSDLNVGILYLFVISSPGVYGIITMGWSSK
ncbi:hypothetical protein CY35_08G066100, partial [Sphagnum magellanicum]